MYATKNSSESVHGYCYDQKETYEDEDEYYEECNYYDECDYDPHGKKMTITTFSADKKPKRKQDSAIQNRKNTMKIVNKIHKRNQWRSYFNTRNSNMYGVIIINGKQLCVGITNGDFKTLLYSDKNNFESGKHRKGGQSAARFGRIYDNKIKCFIKACAVKINQIFDPQNVSTLNGIIVAGNGTMKQKLFQSNYLKEDTIKKKIIKIVNTSCGGTQAFNEIFQKIQNRQLLDKHEMMNNNDSVIIEQIMEMIQDKDKCDLVCIGVNETIQAITLKLAKFVIQKHSKPVKFLTNEIELHKTIHTMDISITNKDKTWKIVDFVEYMENICELNHIELKVTSGNHATFCRDFSGCIGIMYQRLQYLNDD